MTTRSIQSLASGMGLYIHVPFCKTKCPYCDFNTYQGIESQMGSFLQAVTGELRLWGNFLDRPPVRTVFFGGGTPSYLPDGDIAAILDAATKAFAIDAGAEITIEANPGDLDADACRGLLRQGVNRLSIGVQSLDNGLLRLLGRRHTADGAIEAFQTARAAGFDNVNLDLMYGLPNQSLAQWEDTIERLVALSPEHISLYALTLEEGTPMRVWADQGKIPEPDPDVAADMYALARRALAESGYRHYEISNWAQPGRESQHNLIYWRNEPYLGVGPGAHSRLGEYRFWTVLSPRDYSSRASQWRQSPAARWPAFGEAQLREARTVEGWEYIDADTACAETMFLGLRLLGGLPLPQASATAGHDLAARYHAEIEELITLGLLRREGDTIRLDESAYLIANQVFTRFLD
ncbi:MAG: radical SAM family heme chaperone HemW [Chloroflexi bacterium]|nr:radical SAM family heme chaperone HemW [Chloroflexota bacterium]MYE40189.1 radical SAM family heme chaperone HemW [Chloroflexota bacterium]